MNTEIGQIKSLSSSSISTQESQTRKVSLGRSSPYLIKDTFVYEDLNTEVMIYDEFIAFTNIEAMNIRHFNFNMVFEIIKKQSTTMGFMLIDNESGESYEFYIQNWKTADNWRKILLTKISQRGFHQYFDMQKRIGKGAFGTVYEAIQFQTNVKFATKVLIKQNLQKHYLKSIQNEVKILRKVLNKNIVKFYGVYQTKFAYYLLFEYIQGKTLEKCIKNKELSKQERKQIFKQLLEVLFYLKQSNIIHRDIKPDNIIFTPNRQIKVLDFGLASYADLQSEYKWCGTAGYIAPQTFAKNSSKLSFKIDIFGLGATFFKMIFEKQLYSTQNSNCKQSETDIMELNKKGCSKNLQKQSSFCVGIQADELDLLIKMIQVNPERRISVQLALNHWYFTGSKQQYQKLQNESRKCSKSIFQQLWQKIRPISCTNL